MRLAERMQDLGTETAFEAAARAQALEATGRHVIHLELGEPDFDTPANIREAAERAIDAGLTHYAPPLGLPELRAAIAADATARKGFPVTPDRVVVLPGAKPSIFYSLLALAQPGDEVICPDPGFPIYESMARYAGATPVPLPLRPENDFRLDPGELEQLVTPRTRVLIINSPGNPTGEVFAREDVGRIATIALEHDLVVLADEIYGRLVHEGEHVSIASLPGMAERTVVMDGFSKTFAMTGWRLGYAILPEPLVEPFRRLVINSVSCTATFSQVGALEAITGPQDAMDAMLAEFRARRDLVVAGLSSIPGLRCHRPAGAFYVFPDVSGTGLDGARFADRLLTEAGVSVLPGTGFGRVGAGHVRVSYANSRGNLAMALERIAAFVGSLDRAGGQPSGAGLRTGGTDQP